MRWVKVLAIILGSGWFFPVSCTTSVIVGTRVIASLDERDVRQGNEVHSLFKVAAEPGEAGRSFRVIGKNEIASYMTTSSVANADKSVSFLMSRPSSTIDLEGSEFSYRVLEDAGQVQLIELVESYHDGDNTIWSRYKATKSTISPVSSRMFYFGYMFSAMPYAFGCALFLYFIGRLLRRKYGAPRPIKETA